MDIALDQYLRSNPSVTGSLVSDANGLLVSGKNEQKLFSYFFTFNYFLCSLSKAKGELARNSEIKAGLYTSIGRLAQTLPDPTATLNDGVTVMIDTAGDKQILVRKVGEFTVTVQSSEGVAATR
jgi:hypothetical protein